MASTAVVDHRRWMEASLRDADSAQPGWIALAELEFRGVNPQDPEDLIDDLGNACQACMFGLDPQFTLRLEVAGAADRDDTIGVAITDHPMSLADDRMELDRWGGGEASDRLKHGTVGYQ